MKKNVYQTFQAFSLLSLGILVMILIVYSFNLQKTGPAASRSVGIVGTMTAQENASENKTMYFDAGHGYAYEIKDQQVLAVMAFSSSSYPLAFACGTSTKVGSSVNAPLIQGDILFQEYPRGSVYPTWNRITGEYKEVVSLEEMNLDVKNANPISLSEITGQPIAMQKESCLASSAGASIVLVISLIGLAISFLLYKKNNSIK